MADETGAPSGEQTGAPSGENTGATPAGTPPIGAPPRARNGRRVTAILALMISVVPLSLYAYNLERNVSARRILDKACREVRAARDERLSSEMIATLFESDAPMVIAALRESVDRPCDEAAARLAPWRWNLRVTYAIPRNPQKVAQLGAALDRAKERCPRLMMQAFDELPGQVDPARSAEAAAKTCAPLEQAARELSFIPEERYSAWQWASRMAAVARTLEPVDAPRVLGGQLQR